MVELALADGCIMKKKMLNKIKKGHHGNGHGHGHGHGGKPHHHHGGVVCSCLAGHPAGGVGGEIVVVLHGRHHHHHHHHYHHGGGPYGMMPAPACDGEEQHMQHNHHGKHHHRREHGHRGHRAILEGLRCLNHHARRHHRRCARGLGFILQNIHGGEGSGAGVEEDHHQQQQTTEATAPTVPQAEELMNNLNLGEQTDKEAYQQP